jgi:hypothetical protein
MPLFTLDHPGDLDAPVVVCAFDGWVDAGAAATTAAAHLAEDADVIATFDPDALFDYRARRPTLDIVDGNLLDLDWPELHLRRTRLDGRDLLVLAGPEPDYRWRELADDVVALMRLLDVSAWVSLGAIPAAVAHTRPVPILGTAADDDMLPTGIPRGPQGRLRVPSAAVSVLEMAVGRSGIPTIGLYAQVPHYISAEYPAASVELLVNLGRHLGVEVPLGSLPREVREQRALLDTATSADERTRTYVTQLESMADEARLPAGDELIADIERFLRDRGTAGGGG